MSNTPNNENNEKLDLLKFPCDFAIKAMGEDRDNFDLLVLEIANKHCKNLKKDAMTKRSSSRGKYISINIKFIAHSRKQLDDLHAELSGHERVKMVL